MFTIAGAGTVVTGTLAGGGLEVGHEIEISPEGRHARVRTIQSHKKEVNAIGPGNRVALNLAGLERQGAERGDAVVRASQWRPTHLVDALVRVLPEWAVGPDHTLSEKGSHLLYVGSAETPVRIKLFGTATIAAGETGFAQLFLRDPLPLARGDKFVLRDAGRKLSFGGGVVLDPLARSARRTDEAHRSLLRRLAESSDEDALVALVEADGALAVRDAVLRSGLEAPGDSVRRLGDLLVSGGHFEELSSALRSAIAAHHTSRPLERGMPRESARAATGLEGGAFDALVDALSDVVSEAAVVRLHSHAVSMTPEQEQARDEVIAAIEGGGFTPPLTKDLGADPALLRALVDSGDLVLIGEFHLTAAQATEARSKVRARIESEGPVTVAQIRDLLGTSRKYAVPLCEWLDQTGATLRQGDARILGPRP